MKNSYDSDESSIGDSSGTSTSVVLGYASKTPTDDLFSQLGGCPSWLSPNVPPPPSLATCKVCNSYLTLLLQLNGDLPDRFPGHERRLYVWACRRPPRKRKSGSVRAFRASKIARVAPESEGTGKKQERNVIPRGDVGGMLFGTRDTSLTRESSNPFSLPSSQLQSNGKPANPFSTAPAPLASLAAIPPQKPLADSVSTPSNLSETFAQKARISTSAQIPTSTSQQQEPPQPWPPESSFPHPYPAYHLDAEHEYLYPTASSTNDLPPAQYRDLMDTEPSASQPNAKDEKDAYESSHDTAFQHFADRLAHSPEQVLRYEFAGQPLLYSKTDAVGKLFSSGLSNVEIMTGAAGAAIPSCANCASPRLFEFQLTPHAITVLEEELDAAVVLKEGMEWGSIIVGVCGVDCVPQETKEDEVAYVEEWVGVQWEEAVTRGTGVS